MGCLGFYIQNLTACIGPAVGANRMRGFELLALRAGDEVRSTERVMGAASVARRARGAFLGYGMLCHKNSLQFDIFERFERGWGGAVGRFGLRVFRMVVEIDSVERQAQAVLFAEHRQR